MSNLLASLLLMEALFLKAPFLLHLLLLLEAW
jgi:hypothetical protein